MKDFMSKIHLELFDRERFKVFQKLTSFRRSGYLAGGTALALQINHRKSVDFDIFIFQEVRKSLLRKCRGVFGQKLEVLMDNSDQLTFLTPEKISVSFVFYEYKNLLPLIKTSYINLASFQDIAVDKAQTIGRRAVWRDYVDIFFLLKEKKMTLKEIIKIARKKFKGGFNENLFLEQLTYFDDLEVVKIGFLKEAYSEKEIKRFLEEEVRRYLKKVLTT